MHGKYAAPPGNCQYCLSRSPATPPQLLSFFDHQRFRYLRLEFDGDLLVGALAMGLTQHVGVIRGLVQTKLHLGAWKDTLMKDPLRVMEAYLAATQGVGPARHAAEAFS